MSSNIRKGFSIFEAITAVVILSVAMGALLSGVKMAAGAMRHCELCFISGLSWVSILVCEYRPTTQRSEHPCVP